MEKGRLGIPSEIFGTKNREILRASCQFEFEKRSVSLSHTHTHTHTHTQCTLSKVKQMLYVQLTVKPLLMVRKKAQIIEFDYLIKGWTNIVDQMKYCYITRARSCRWVMVAL